MINITPSPLHCVCSVTPPVFGGTSVKQRILLQVVRRLSRLIGNVNARIQAVTVEAGQNIIPHTEQPERLPLIRIWDQDEAVDIPRTQGLQHKAITLTIDYWMQSLEPRLIAIDNQKMHADIEMALWRDYDVPLDSNRLDPYFRGLADSLTFETSELTYGISSNYFTGARSRWLITYSYLSGSPELRPHMERQSDGEVDINS